MLVSFHISGVFKIFFVLYFFQKTYSVILIFWNFLKLLALFSTLVNGPVILERNVYSAVLRCSAINVSQIHSVVVHTFTDLSNFFLEKSVKGFRCSHLFISLILANIEALLFGAYTFEDFYLFDELSSLFMEYSSLSLIFIV